jgi:hypothetical protein
MSKKQLVWGFAVTVLLFGVTSIVQIPRGDSSVTCAGPPTGNGIYDELTVQEVRRNSYGLPFTFYVSSFNCVEILEENVPENYYKPKVNYLLLIADVAVWAAVGFGSVWGYGKIRGKHE